MFCIVKIPWPVIVDCILIILFITISISSRVRLACLTVRRQITAAAMYLCSPWSHGPARPYSGRPLESTLCRPPCRPRRLRRCTPVQDRSRPPADTPPSSVYHLRPRSTGNDRVGQPAVVDKKWQVFLPRGSDILIKFKNLMCVCKGTVKCCA